MSAGEQTDVILSRSYESMHLPPLRQDAPTPLWLQLKHALRDQITFHLSPGARIPSESELCRQYSLSRVTVRQAITALVNEGLLGRQQGRGTFVLPRRMSIPPQTQVHFLDDGFEAGGGMTVWLDESALEKPPLWICKRLGMGDEERAHKIRLNLADENKEAEVLASRTIYIPDHVAPSLQELDLTIPVHRILEDNYDLVPTMAEETMRLIRADPLRAEMLSIEAGKSLILVERVVYLANGEPVEYARTYYRADRYRFEHKLVRSEASDEGEQELGNRRHRVSEIEPAAGLDKHGPESSAAE